MKTAVLRDSRGRILARFWLDTLKGAARALAALVDLGARLWLAQTFLVSGLLKVGNWNNALELAANEYPVSWLDPVTAAHVGAGIELLCPIFLAVGLFTRAAAVPLVLFLIVTNFERWRVGRYFWNKLGLEYTMMWLVATFYFLVHGGGLYSLDHLIGWEF